MANPIHAITFCKCLCPEQKPRESKRDLENTVNKDTSVQKSKDLPPGQKVKTNLCVFRDSEAENKC